MQSWFEDDHAWCFNSTNGECDKNKCLAGAQPSSNQGKDDETGQCLSCGDLVYIVCYFESTAGKEGHYEKDQ